MKPSKLEIETGPESQDYQIGNFLNAIDAVVWYFYGKRINDVNNMADALELYAKHVRDEG
jgi:hypothetical protein